MITAKEIITEINEALKEFGRYNYYDKGAREVMDVRSITNRLKQMTAKQVEEVLTGVKTDCENAQPFLLDAIMELGNNWNGKEAEIFAETEIFAEYYG